MLTADTITDAEIRTVVTDLYQSVPGIAPFIRNAACDLVDDALSGNAASRARCAEIINARNGR